MIRRYIESVAVVFSLLICGGSLQAQVLPSLLMNQDPVSLAMGSTGAAEEADAPDFCGSGHSDRLRPADLPGSLGRL